MESKKLYLRSSEVARLFDVNPSTISLWVKKKKLRPHRTLGGNFRFRRSDIEHLLAHREQFGAEETGIERRTEQRFAFEYPVRICFGESDFSVTYNAEVKDVSAHGMALIINETNGFDENPGKSHDEKLSILNLPQGIFKNIVVGRIRHFARTGNALAVGVRTE